MNFKKFVITGLLGASMLFLSGLANAVPITSWSNITNNGNADVSGQLTVDVTALVGNKVMFQFMNNVGISSSITDIYFDDKVNPLLSLPMVLQSSAGVSFSAGANPSNLPGGNTVSFSADFATDSNVPTSSKGINAASEWLRITFNLAAGKAFDDVLTQLNAGDLVIGMHVQSIGRSGGSDSYINTRPPVSVPEPTSLLLLGAGFVGLAAARRRRS